MKSRHEAGLEIDQDGSRTTRSTRRCIDLQFKAKGSEVCSVVVLRRFCVDHIWPKTSSLALGRLLSLLLCTMLRMISRTDLVVNNVLISQSQVVMSGLFFVLKGFTVFESS